MKKTGLIVIAMLSTAATFAQATLSRENPKMTALDSCIRQYNSEKAMAKRAMIKGEFKVSTAEYAAADVDKKQISAIAEALKNEGIRHPLLLAHKEIKREDNKMIIADVATVKADKLARKKAVKAGDGAAATAAENNLLIDKKKLKADIRVASRDDRKHFVLIRPKA